MKKCYFLDKIYNSNFKEFEAIIEEIVNILNFSKLPFNFLKIEDNWIVDVEKENECLTICFNDYSMTISSTKDKNKEDISNKWQGVFQKFLRPKQKNEYAKNLKELQENKISLSSNMNDVVSL